MLADIELRLQKLESVYEESISEKMKLESIINVTESRLNRSDLLVVALSDEQNRWENNIRVFHLNISVTVSTLILLTFFFFRCFLNVY